MIPGPDRASNSRRLNAALTVAALLVSMGLLTVRLGAREFWTDEVVTAGHVGMLNQTDDVYHPRGYYLLLYGWRLVFGEGDLALRSFSVPWALASLVLLHLIGRRLVPAGQVTLALWLCALSPFFVLHFRMARFFSMMTAVFLVVVYLAVLAAQEGRWRHWVLLGVASVGLLHTNYLAATLLLPIYLVLAGRAGRAGHLPRFALAAAPVVVAGLVLLRYLMYQVQVVHATATAADALSAGKIMLRLALPAWSLWVGETTDPWRAHVTAPALAAGLVALWQGLRVRPAQGSVVPEFASVRWLWPVSVLATCLVLSVVARAEPLSSAGRSTIFAAPLAYLTMAVGLANLGSRRLAAVALAALLVSNAYGLMNYYAGRQFLNPGYATPWRQVADLIRQRQRPGDLVLAYYDTTITRYGDFPTFINGGNPYEKDRYIAVERWPACGKRLWLITRDRGSAEARRLARETISRLTPLAQQVEVFGIMPYTPLDRAVRSLILGRQVEDYYLKVYLFTPPSRVSRNAPSR